jgi:hypothetical protein
MFLKWILRFKIIFCKFKVVKDQKFSSHGRYLMLDDSLQKFLEVNLKKNQLSHFLHIFLTFGKCNHINCLSRGTETDPWQFSTCVAKWQSITQWIKVHFICQSYKENIGTMKNVFPKFNSLQSKPDPLGPEDKIFFQWPIEKPSLLLNA